MILQVKGTSVIPTLDSAQVQKGRKPKKSAEKQLCSDVSSPGRALHQQLFLIMAYQTFQELPIWQESVRLAAQIYRYFETSELKRDFRMRDQVRAAAVSVVSNIAEGFEYRNDKQFIRFLTYSKGSLSEMRSQLFILYEAGMMTEFDHRHFEEKALELGRKIGGFIKYLQSAN